MNIFLYLNRKDDLPVEKLELNGVPKVDNILADRYLVKEVLYRLFPRDTIRNVNLGCTSCGVLVTEKEQLKND